MNTQATVFLLLSALSVGFIHTLFGPDHYIPFIVLAKSRKWSITKTIVITTLCGIGHVLSAVALGVVAISIGMTLSKLNFIESFRGEVAAWLLLGFGFAYFIWGVRSAIRNQKHTLMFICILMAPSIPMIMATTMNMLTCMQKKA